MALRDRFGVKPLYYTVVDGTWIITSEIKALLAYPGTFSRFNRARVLNFMANCLTDHTDETLLRDIHTVQPGTYTELTGDRVTRRTFWTLRIDTTREKQPE